MGVVKEVLDMKERRSGHILQLWHLLFHPHPTADAATFPARGKAGASSGGFGEALNVKIRHLQHLAASVEVISLGNRTSQPVVTLNKLEQKLMQPAVDDLRHRPVPQAFQRRVGQLMRFGARAVIVGETVQIIDNVAVTEGQRAGHALVQDEVIGHIGGLVFGVIDPAVRAVRRDRAQQRFPLIIVHRGADIGDRGQEHVIFSHRRCARCCRRAQCKCR